MLKTIGIREETWKLAKVYAAETGSSLAEVLDAAVARLTETGVPREEGARPPAGRLLTRRRSPNLQTASQQPAVEQAPVSRPESPGRMLRPPDPNAVLCQRGSCQHKVGVHLQGRGKCTWCGCPEFSAEGA